MPRVFISYRRADSIAYAGRLYDRLAAAFGADQVFMDIDTLDPGVDFVEVLHRTVETCDVCLVVIGRGWTSAADERGAPRLFDAADFVALEVATALAKPDARVVPVLVGGAHMPASGELPERLQALTRRHAVELPDTGFQHAVGRLIESLDGVARPDAPRPMPPAGRAREASSVRRRWPLLAAAAALAVGGAIWASRPRAPEVGSAPATTATAAPGLWSQIRLIAIDTAHLDLRPDGAVLAAVLRDEDASTDRIAIVATASGETVRTMDTPGHVNGIAYGPDGRLVATAGSAIRLWDAESGALVHEYPGAWRAESVAFAPNGRLLAVGDAARVVVFDLRAHVEAWSAPVERPAVDHVVFSPDSTTLAYAGADLDLVRFATPLRPGEPASVEGQQQVAVAFSPDARWVAIGGLAGDIQLRELPSLRLARQWPAPATEDASVDTLRFAADSRSLLALGFGETRLRTWSVPDGGERQTLALPGRPAVFALSDDGATLVVGGSPTSLWTRR